MIGKNSEQGYAYNLIVPSIRRGLEAETVEIKDITPEEQK